MELAFPEIEAPATSAAVAVVTSKPIATIKDAAIAHLRAREPEIRALAERYRQVAFDVSTPKGLKAAKEARQDLRENGRFAVQRARDATKDLLNTAKKDVEAEADRLIALVKPIEDNAHEQIEAREKDLAAEKEREAARKQAHLDNIALIAGWAQRAHGQSADKLAGAISFVEGMDVSTEAFEEFAPAAEKAKADTIQKLRELHAQAVEAERIRAENEARQRTISVLAALNAHVAGGIGEDAERLALRLATLKDLLPQGAADEVTAGYLTAYAQIDAMFDQAKQREALQAQLDAMKAKEAAEQEAAAKAAEPPPAPQAPAVPETPASEPETAAPVDAGGTGVSAMTREIADKHAAEGNPLHTHAAPPAAPSPAEERLLCAAALAIRFGATVCADGLLFSVNALADLIDAARAA